jgi:hypothetical protein
MYYYDFFSGCGGTSEGMRSAGLSVKLGIDLDLEAARTYRSNFPRAGFIRRDIRYGPAHLTADTGAGGTDTECGSPRRRQRRDLRVFLNTLFRFSERAEKSNTSGCPPLAPHMPSRCRLRSIQIFRLRASSRRN